MGLEFELVLPCYNESKSLARMLDRAVAAAQQAGFSPERFQLVLVDNGSTDDTATTLKNLAGGPKGAWFRPVQVVKNQGYGFGLWTGLKTTTAPNVAWSHADEQCDPKDAFTALSALNAATDPSRTLVKGVRSGRSGKERFVSRIFELFALLLLGLKVYEINAQPKLFPRSLLAACKNPPYTFAFDLYVLYQASKLGWEVKTIPVLFPPRVHGFSNWAHGFLRRYSVILGMIRYMRTLASLEGRL